MGLKSWSGNPEGLSCQIGNLLSILLERTAALLSCHFRRHRNVLYAKRRLVRAEWSLYTFCIVTGSPIWNGFGLALRLR